MNQTDRIVLGDGRSLPDFRQVVLLTADLEAVLAQARSELGAPVGFREPEMADVGFLHEVFGFAETYVEVCQPIDAESRQGQRVRGQGDFGFMVVVQVEDLDATIRRAAEIGVEPLFQKPHHGNTISQWHPRDFGTLAEFDQMTEPESWHFAPAVYRARDDSVVRDIAAAYIGVTDPGSFARRWAAVLDGDLGDDGRAVVMGRRRIVFTEESEGSGLHTVDCLAADPARAGSSVLLGGVTFRLT